MEVPRAQARRAGGFERREAIAAGNAFLVTVPGAFRLGQRVTAAEAGAPGGFDQGLAHCDAAVEDTTAG